MLLVYNENMTVCHIKPKSNIEQEIKSNTIKLKIELNCKVKHF